MYFYIIQLFDIKFKEDIILALTSADILYGTCIEGENYDFILNKEYPFFTGFFKTKLEKERVSALFFGMVDSKEKIVNFSNLLKQTGLKNKEKEIYRIILIEGEKID